jgi:hypothetical protein
MKKWEYLSKVYTYYPPEVHQLNELGQEGWELITVLDLGSSQMLAYFKREII